MTAFDRLPLLATSGIVLAGGRSHRYGRDKLAEPLEGRPLLHHAVLTLAGVCREVIVVAAADGDLPLLPDDPERRLHLVRDAHLFGGPLAGLLTGLEAAAWDAVLVVGGDMPWVRPPLLRHLAGVLGTTGPEAVVLREGHVPRSLPLGIRRDRALHLGLELPAEDRRSLRTLLAQLVVVELEEADWRRFDPEGRSLLDIDRPDDLPDTGR